MKQEGQMNGESSWLFPTTPIEDVLRMRPRSLTLFESHGADPWPWLAQGVGDFCARNGVPYSRFTAELANMPVPEPNLDGAAAPLVDLLDRLVADHRFFTGRTLPAIGRVLSESFDGDQDSLQRLQILSPYWPGFAHSLADHLREEEDVLFQRILRYDSAQRLGFPDPDFQGGSVRVFSTVRLMRHGHRDQELLKEFMDRFLPPRTEHRPCRLMAALHPLFEDFRERLVRHASLESLHLLPRAADLERGLYDLSISGRQEARI